MKYWAYSEHHYEDVQIDLETEDFDEARHVVWQAVVNGQISEGHVVVLHDNGQAGDEQYSCYRDSQGVVREWIPV